MTVHPFRLVLICGLAGLLGCGYEHKSLYSRQSATICVPIFENRTFYRGLEFDVTEALIKEIELKTPYKVTGAGDADTIVYGTIIEARQRVLSRTATGDLPQDLEWQVTVDFEWKSLDTGQTLRQRKGLAVVGRYIPTRPVSQTLDLAQHQLAQRLADTLVSVMMEDW